MASMIRPTRIVKMAFLRRVNAPDAGAEIRAPTITIARVAPERTALKPSTFCKNSGNVNRMPNSPNMMTMPDEQAPTKGPNLERASMSRTMTRAGPAARTLDLNERDEQQHADG